MELNNLKCNNKKIGKKDKSIGKNYKQRDKFVID